MECPNCHKPMKISSYTDNNILYKCPVLECGYTCLVDATTGEVKQGWTRNNVVPKEEQ